MRRSSLLPVLILLCISGADGGQAVRVFDSENGLPHNRVNRIFFDSKHFLWICTDDGLSRFDGHQFVSYTTSDGLPHKHVNAMLETRSGEYWIATDGGISRFDPRPRQTRFTTYAPSEPEDARHVNALLEDSDGSLLLATSFGLYRFTRRDGKPAFDRIDVHRSPGGLMVNALARDARGALWLATNNGLYRRRDNAGWEHYGTESGLTADGWFGAKPAAFVNSFAHDTNGRLWAAFKGGFGRIATDSEPGSPVLDFVHSGDPRLGRGFRSLLFGRDGRRWIAAESGFWEWIVDSDGTSQFRQHGINDRFPREAYLCVNGDADGNLWIGTRRSGLVQVGSPRFQTFDISDGLRLGLDQLLLESKSGQVYVFDVGDKRSLIYQWDGRRRFSAVQPALPELDTSILQTAMQDHKAAWWFSTPSGLVRFDKLGGQSDTRLLPDSAVNRFFEDRAGDLWITHWPLGAACAKLARWERRSGRIQDESERLPPEGRMGITAFAQDHAGAVWIALQHPGGRILRLKDGRFQPISAQWSGHINKLFVDSKRRIWATSTESGLGLIEHPQSPDPQLRAYTRAHGLSTNEVWCVTEDLMGRIYAGTARGVDRLDPDTGQIVHYSTADGLVRGDIRTVLRDRHGDLWFASAHGVSRFTPGEDHSLAPARARITGIRMAGVPLPLSEFGESKIGPVRVLSHQNSLQIDFAATDYRAQESLRYQFRLDHQTRADPANSWQNLGTTSTVHLVDVSPGDFTFELRAVTPDGLSGEPASVSFSILQPIWRIWWFQLACAIAIAGIGWAMRIRRLQQQLALERVRSDIAMDLHDDIGAGLSRISVIGEALKSRLRERDSDVQRMLDDISGSSRQLVTDMGDIVWSLDPGREQVVDVASRLRAFGSDLLEASGIEWTVNGPQDSPHRSLPPVLKRQFYLVLKEGIHNISKHSRATTATLRLWFDTGLLCAELTDNGCGVAPGDHSGNGVRSMRERVRQLGGHLEISTPDGGGTSIRIRVPLSRGA